MRSPSSEGAVAVPGTGVGAVAAAAAGAPPTHIEHMNVSHNSRMHIGPQFVSVTQNVHQDRVVKGRLLGLVVEARGEASGGARRLRCGVAVFICWALVVAAALAIYVGRLALAHRPMRLDLDISESWYLRRGDWQAMPAYDTQFLLLPVRYALVGHSVTATCTDRYNCTERVLDIQREHQRHGWADIGPNFLVAGDEGLVLEGRGANVLGVMVQSWNTRSVSLMFVGDFRRNHDEPHPSQLAHLRVLLDALVTAGVLHPEYALLGHCQAVGWVYAPGVRLLRELRAFKPHWDARNISTCLEWSPHDNDITTTTDPIFHTLQ